MLLFITAGSSTSGVHLSPVAKLALLFVVAVAIVVGAAYLGSQKSQLQTQLQAYALSELAGLEVFDEPTQAPTTAFRDRDGNPVRLTDFDGSFVLANFWATWCAPCVTEMPSLDRLQEKMRGTALKVITISLDRKGFELIDPFLEEIGIRSLPAYLDHSNRLSLEVGAFGLPTTILIGPDGEFLARMVGPAEWDSDEVVGMFEAITVDIEIPR